MEVTAPKPHMAWTQAFRVAVTACAVGVVSCGVGAVHPADFVAALVLFALVFLSRSVPVVLAREKAITFTAASVFAAAILLDGVSAGLFALLACSLHAWLFRNGGKGYTVFLGGQYALSAMVSARFYLWIGANAPSRPGSLGDLGAICCAAVAFILVNLMLVALGNLGTRYATWQYAESVAGPQALAYLVSFPYAVLLIYGYQTIGLTALPAMAALLLLCAYAVRLRVENRILAKQLLAIETLGNSCASSVRAEAPLQKFLSLARDVATYQCAVVWMLREGSSVLEPKVAFPEGTPLPDPEIGATGSIVDRCASRGVPLLIRNTKLDPRVPGGDSGQTWILLPMMLHGRAVGVVQFVRRATRPFILVEQRRLAALVPHVTVAFESVRIRQMMHRYANMATTDGLTGLYNHRKCHEILADEIKRASRYNRLMSVLMLDVDAFKQFNDTFGHPQGDVLLKGVARILRESLRATDFIGRYGGEEFLVILPETGRAEACVLAERVRRTIGATDFVLDRGQVVCRTVSIGVASYPENGPQAADVVRAADEALYRAKRAGKNRVLTS